MFLSIIQILIGAGSQNGFFGALVSRYNHPQPQRLGNGNRHLAKTARAAGDQQRFPAFGFQLFRNALPSSQTRKWNRRSGSEIISRGMAARAD